MAVGTTENLRLNPYSMMNMNTPVTLTQINKLRSLAKKRSKAAGEPLHQCLEIVALANGFETWKQVVIERHKPLAGSASTVQSQPGISPGLAMLGLTSKVLEEARAFHRMFSTKAVAEATHNPLKGENFIDVTIEGHRFQGGLSLEPYIALYSVPGGRSGGSCALGVASISNPYRNRLAKDFYRQWAVCKYETQSRIDLSNLSEAGMHRLALEFGLPILNNETGIVFGHHAYFYVSKAYDALVNWASAHPRKIQNFRANSYLGHWALAAMLDAGVRPWEVHEQLIADINLMRAG